VDPSEESMVWGLVGWLLVPAAAASASRCTAAKIGTGAAYFAAVLRCEAKAVQKGAPLDPLCFAKSQEKLFSRSEKAERKGDCLTVGDALPFQDVLDDAISATVEVTETPEVATCCELGVTCQWVAPAACTSQGGTPGAAGSACDPGGLCVSAPAPGPCCGEIEELVLLGPPCFGIAGMTEPGCKEFGGSFKGSALCDPTGQCLGPDERPRSRCTKKKLKALGSYFRAVARCEAKAVKSAGTADVVCVARAQSRLQSAFTRAERKSDCIARGEVMPARDEADAGLQLAFTVLEPPPSVCCAAAMFCTWFPDAASCTAVGGSPGAPGTVCDGTTATCAAPPAGEAGCCQDFLNLQAQELTCLVGPGIDAASCAAASATWISDAVCLPSRLCID
jgi:hypothetical protein